VLGVHATTVLARVVQVVALWDGTDQGLVGEAVSGNDLLPSIDTPALERLVAVEAGAKLPAPAGQRFDLLAEPGRGLPWSRS